MLYQDPSGSKSLSVLPLVGSGCATGKAIRNALRLAIKSRLPSALTRITPFGIAGTCGTPCEQPAPPSKTYRVLPIKATSAAPLIRLPVCGLDWLDGRLSTTVVTTPLALILEMREPVMLP